MRWKLANGGVIASTKQPVKHRDFDRLVVNSISGNETDITDVSIMLYNPSTHTRRKCHSNELYISITPSSRYIGQVALIHLPHNYYLVSGDLQTGMNDISNQFDYSDNWRDGLRGDYHDDGRAYCKKISLDRLINPTFYTDYFELCECQRPKSDPGDPYYVVVKHDPWDVSDMTDAVNVVLWKGPCRKHKKRISKIARIDVDRQY